MRGIPCIVFKVRLLGAIWRSVRLPLEVRLRPDSKTLTFQGLFFFFAADMKMVKFFCKAKWRVVVAKDPLCQGLHLLFKPGLTVTPVVQWCVVLKSTELASRGLR